jgi:hypothetical protein
MARFIAAVSFLFILIAPAFGAVPSSEERRMCDLINAERARRGIQPQLRWSDALYDAAKAHSDDMADNGCFQHNSCNGENWVHRVNRYYPGWYGLGEVITYSTSDAQFAVNGWMDSETHRNILMNSAYLEIGCAMSLGETNFGNFYLATADLGTRGFLPQPTPTPGPLEPTPIPTPSPSPSQDIENLRVRATRTKTTVLGYIQVSPDSRLDDSVYIEIGSVPAGGWPDECVAPTARGARSICGERLTRFMIAPAGVPRYRFRIEVPGQFPTDAEVYLMAAGQEWRGS